MSEGTKPRVDRRMTAAETEQRILGATIELLDAGASLAGLSVNKIVDVAGVSRATFYLHFGDKRALVARLAATELHEFQRVTADFLGDPDAGRAELAATVREMVRLWRAHAGVLSSLIELAEYDADTREEWQSVIGAIAQEMAPAIERRNPQIDKELAASLAEILAWTGERSLHQMVGREADDAQACRVEDGLIEAAWRIISPATSLPA